MSTRITEKQLETAIAYLNRITGNPEKPWEKDENGRMRANIGNYHLSGAYGGVCIHRMCNNAGGVSTPIFSGHIPKREAMERLQSYIRGIEHGKGLLHA